MPCYARCSPMPCNAAAHLPSLAPQMHPDKVQGSEEEKAEAAKKFSDVSHGACWSS